MTDRERAELERLRMETKVLREEIAGLKERLKDLQIPVAVQDLIKALTSVVDDDLPVYVYDLSTDESFPLIIVDPTISDRIELNFRSEQV
jgi:hypothetical protein